MFKIAEVSNKISNNISKELNLDEDRTSVINYGIFSGLQILISLILVMIFGGIFNVLIESIIISFVIGIFRKSSGGAHANTPGKCATIGTIATVGMAIIASYIEAELINIILSGIVLFIWGYLVVYFLAPVDSKAKPIRKKEKREKLKRNSIIILSIYLIIVLLNIILYCFIKDRKLLTYSMCIYLGILWQVFSLTNKGHYILGKLDSLF